MIRVQHLAVAPFLCLALGCSSHTGLLAARTTEHGRVGSEGLPTVRQRIPPPPGFEHVPTQPGSFGEWLTGLPVKPDDSAVLLWDGSTKPNQAAHHAVIDLDVGESDLQQCADAIIRLRAEYLWAAGRSSDIHFNFTSGDRADYTKWSEGYRPRVSGDAVIWAKRASPDRSYSGLRQYLDAVFTYAGTASLSTELVAVPEIEQMSVGDVFIRGGFPGHAVIVVDMAESDDGRKRLFLLAQSYMPAQDIHVLRNPMEGELSPWYGIDFGDELVTPEYTFRRDELKRF